MNFQPAKREIARLRLRLDEDLRKLREAWQDLWYVIARDTRLLRLIRRLGMTEKPWVDEARKRVET